MTHLQKTWLGNLTVNIAVYLICSYIIWDFRNPFYWIIHLSSYTAEQRGLGLFGVLCWQGIQFYFLYDIVFRPKKTDET